ncbi:hypothetical protein, partial [Prevotella sp.]|uniref:hypothetical protein n=1 Tax=Prevotella sp. TaxID=59823 RepID=UPI0025E8F159
ILYIQPMSDGMGRELAYLSSHATNRYFIPNWGRGIIYFVRLLRLWRGLHSLLQLAFSCMVLVYVFSVLLHLLGGYGVPAITWAVEYKSKIFVLLFVLSACLGYGGDAIASYS